MAASRENMVVYSLAALLGLGFVYAVHSADPEILEILLYPHAQAAEIYYHLTLNYIDGIGYTSADGAFTIGRECMGYKFMLLMFFMNVLLFTRSFSGFHKALWLFTNIASAYLVGILIGSIRIIAVIPFVNHEKFVPLHSGIGISLYFAVLLADYIAVNKLIERSRHESTC